MRSPSSQPPDDEVCDLGNGWRKRFPRLSEKRDATDWDKVTSPQKGQSDWGIVAAWYEKPRPLCRGTAHGRGVEKGLGERQAKLMAAAMRPERSSWSHHGVVPGGWVRRRFCF